ARRARGDVFGAAEYGVARGVADADEADPRLVRIDPVGARRAHDMLARQRAFVHHTRVVGGVRAAWPDAVADSLMVAERTGEAADREVRGHAGGGERGPRARALAERTRAVESAGERPPGARGPRWV